MDLRIDSPASLAWQDERNAAAAAHLSGLPSRGVLGERVARLLADTRHSPSTRRGSRRFELAVLSPDAEHAALVVRDGPGGEHRVLVDPDRLGAQQNAPVALGWFAPAPDGRTLAFATSTAGAEVYRVTVLDVETGAELPEDVPWNVAVPVAWLPDSSGFWCSSREVVDGEFRMGVHRYDLGSGPAPSIGTPTGLMDPRPLVSPDGRHVALASGNTERRLDWILAGTGFRPLLRDVPGSASGVFHGDDLIAIVGDGEPRGRLVRIPVATAADPATWTELVPGSDDVLHTVAVVGDAIVLGSLRDAVCRIRLLDLDGEVRYEVDLPGEGNAAVAVAGNGSHPALPMFEAGDAEISFVFSTPGASPAVYRYLVSERRLEVVHPPAVRIDGLVVSTITATSVDGTPVPAHVVHREDLDPSVPHPTLIHGYGGFNLAWVPAYLAENAAWVEAGGLVVLPHLRGGSDFGSDWWRGGTRDRKQRTFDDLFAVAEHLIGAGRTTPSRLAVRGESNGGLLAGAAVAQRPDLWAAVVCDVPILDLLGFHRDPITHAIGRVEYGDPLDPAEAEWLRAISPVHTVRPGVHPAVLVTAGANDPRCPVWHARVFVDLLERAQTGDAPILLRVHHDQGHGAAGLGARAAEHADWLAFAAGRTGLDLG